MTRSNGVTGPVNVTGPGGVDRQVPSIGVGLAFAQGVASRHDGPGTWYVRGEGEAFAVVRQDDRVIVTAPVQALQRERGTAPMEELA